MNILNLKKYRINKVMNIIFIASFMFFYKISPIYATLIKCSSFIDKDKGYTALDGNINRCNNILPLVKTTNYNLVQLSQVLNINEIEKDADNNIIIHRPQDLSLSINDYPNSSSSGTIFTDDNLKLIFNNVKLCGDDWNTYAYKYDNIRNVDKEKWYPDFGSFSNSYEYKLNKIFTNAYSCEGFITVASNGEITLKDAAINCLKSTNNFNSNECSIFKEKCFPIIPMFKNNKYCDLNDCSSIKESTRNIKNRFYREYIYGGEEITLPLIANPIDSVYDSIIVTDSNYFTTDTVYTGGGGCYDPRLDSEKGYTGFQQKYYFKGKEAANYACERFDYKGQECIKLDNSEVFKANSQECRELFALAKKCCENRRNGGVCLYIPGNVQEAIAYNKNVEGVTINGTQYNFLITPDKKLSNINMISFCSTNNMNINSNYCALNLGSASKMLSLTSYYGQLDENSYLTNSTDKICVRTANLYPYNFNLMAGTEIKDFYCDNYYESCTNPYDSNDITSDSYALWNNMYVNDYNIIWNTTAGSDVRTRTNAYGKAKNFLNHNAHCVESSEKPASINASTSRQSQSSKYMPQVCYDFSKSSSQYSSSYDSKGQAILSALSGGENMRNLTAPVVECVLETVKNMFLNRAGISLCKDKDEIINDEGLCGGDTFGPPAHIRHEDYDARYSGEYNAYEYMIGEKLDDDYNIFARIQNYVRNIIKTLLSLAIVAAAARMLISGNFAILDTKNVKAIVLWTIKLALVLYFALSSAWQDRFYNLLTSSSEAVYNKLFELSLLGYDDYRGLYDYVECDIRTEEENIKKAYTRMCHVEYIKETYYNCQLFNNYGQYTYNIPNEATELYIQLWGASSFAKEINADVNPGRGGYTYGTIDLVNNNPFRDNKLYLYIGGTAGTECSEYENTNCGSYFSCGGYNGGGDGAKGYYNNGHGGGGSTDVRFEINTSDPNDWYMTTGSRIMVAGGGGGNSNNGLYSGGDGGGGNNPGTSGKYKYIGNDMVCYGKGGTLSAGGAGGDCGDLCRGIQECIDLKLCTGTFDCNNNQKCKEILNSYENYTICQSSVIPEGDCRNNDGSFGKGGNGQEGYYGGSGGGGGYYGGGASSKIDRNFTSMSNNHLAAAGGGSGYINTAVVVDGGGETGVWSSGNGKAEVCYNAANMRHDTEILDSYDDNILSNVLPDSINNGTSTSECVVTSEEYEAGVGVVKYKTCYSNCGDLVDSPENYKTTLINKGTQYGVKVNENILPKDLPTIQEVLLESHLQIDDINTKVTENKYYSNCKYVSIASSTIQYSSKYDGCYFGNEKYPEGKEYLAIFDTLDCKLGHYFNLAVGDSSTILKLIIAFLLSSFIGYYIGYILAFLVTFILALIFSIVFKIFYIYLTNMITVTLLVFVSPFTIPFALIPKFKGIFDNWLANLMGACMQLIMVMVFTGFSIVTIDTLALGNGQYINHDENGRLPSLFCPTSGTVSPLCILSQNAENETEMKSDFLSFLNIGPTTYTFSIIANGRFFDLIITMISFVVSLYVFSELANKIPDLSKKIFSGPGMQKSDVNFRNSAKYAAKSIGVGYQGIRFARMTSASLLKALGRGVKNIKNKEFGSKFKDTFKPTKEFLRNNLTPTGWKEGYNIWDKTKDSVRNFGEAYKDNFTFQGLKDRVTKKTAFKKDDNSNKK